jgi:hypothetical protein
MNGATWLSSPQPPVVSNDFHEPPLQVLGLFEGMLWEACGRRPAALAAMGGATSEAEGGGELDVLMSCLNLYRFLLLKDRGGQVRVCVFVCWKVEGSCNWGLMGGSCVWQPPGRTGVWEAGRVDVALVRLGALRASVREALEKGRAHQLNMVEQILTDYLLPLLEEGRGGTAP